MNSDVSRALAAFITYMGLGQVAARELAEQYKDTETVADLPDWLIDLTEDSGE